MSTQSTASPRRHADVNAVVGGLLRDLAYVQTSPQRTFGYKRAAAAVLSLERPLTELRLSNGTLEKIPGIGPASSRVILELLDMGTSPTVERTVELSGRAEEIRTRRSLRTHFLSRAEVVRILSDPAFDGPSLDDYHGDLQMHSEWSDGSPTLDEIGEACIARGYRFAAVTDHSYGLKIAGGMSMASAARAMARHRSSECGVGRSLPSDSTASKPTSAATGSSICPPTRPRNSSWCLRRRTRGCESPRTRPSRMLAAIRAPHVHVLAHPRGRISGSRAGVVARWDEVFAEAARHDVAIELDGDPARQDLDYTLAAHALAAGCLFATRQRRAHHASVALRRDGARPRAARRHSSRSHRQLLADGTFARVADEVGLKPCTVRLKPDTTWPAEAGHGRKVAVPSVMKITPDERDELDEHLAGEAAISKARALLPSFRTTMLMTKGSEAGELHMRPMGLQGDVSTFGGTLWFFADDRSHKVHEIRQEPRVSLSFQNEQENRYLHLAGTASLVTDRSKMRELFTIDSKAWFPGGVDDPHLVLIRIDVTNGTFWDSPGGVVHMLAALTKSVVTGTPGKSGRSGTIDF